MLYSDKHVYNLWNWWLDSLFCFKERHLNQKPFKSSAFNKQLFHQNRDIDSRKKSARIKTPTRRRDRKENQSKHEFHLLILYCLTKFTTLRSIHPRWKKKWSILKISLPLVKILSYRYINNPLFNCLPLSCLFRLIVSTINWLSSSHLHKLSKCTAESTTNEIGISKWKDGTVSVLWLGSLKKYTL